MASSKLLIEGMDKAGNESVSRVSEQGEITR